MDSSINLTKISNQLSVKTLYVDKSRDVSGLPSTRKLSASDMFFTPVPLRIQANPESAVAPESSSSPRVEQNHKLPPPPRTHAAAGEHDPKFVLFLFGAKSVARRTVLLERMDEAVASGAAKLRAVCVKGVFKVRFDRAAHVATTNASSHDTPWAVVGIDAVEQYVGSPWRFASLVHKLISADVAVVCTIDSRNCDWPLLAFCLRALGLSVKRETGVADGIAVRRKTQKSQMEDALKVRCIPEADFPAMTEPVVHVRRFAATSLWDFSSTRAARLAYATRERESYARAYHNSFAVGRLQREMRLDQASPRRQKS